MELVQDMLQCMSLKVRYCSFLYSLNASVTNLSNRYLLAAAINCLYTQLYSVNCSSPLHLWVRSLLHRVESGSHLLLCCSQQVHSALSKLCLPVSILRVVSRYFSNFSSTDSVYALRISTTDTSKSEVIRAQLTFAQQPFAWSVVDRAQLQTRRGR